MPGKLLQNEIFLWPVLTEYNICRWSLPAFLKAGSNDRKITKTKTDCNHRHKLELCVLRISMSIGGPRLILCLFHFSLHCLDILNFYLLPAILRVLFGFFYLQSSLKVLIKARQMIKPCGSRREKAKVHHGINTTAYRLWFPIQLFSHLISLICPISRYSSSSHLFSSLLISIHYNSF